MGTLPRRQPTRTCVACRTERTKRELVRVVRTPEGLVVLDPSGRRNGRGAYLCADGACWTLALKRGALPRALGIPVPPELRAQLEAGPDSALPIEGEHRGS
ncbi:MAG TPA: YlxR family protein [Candidatus Dormibacteraeota bacterium]|nr:YlxR family protein [Candidatus Dormibacteraeota bacterium]